MNLWEVPGSWHQFTDKDAENQRDQKAYLRTNEFARCGIGHPALLSAYEALSKPTVWQTRMGVCVEEASGSSGSLAHTRSLIHVNVLMMLETAFLLSLLTSRNTDFYFQLLFYFSTVSSHIFKCIPVSSSRSFSYFCSGYSSITCIDAILESFCRFFIKLKSFFHIELHMVPLSHS